MTELLEPHCDPVSGVEKRLKCRSRAGFGAGLHLDCAHFGAIFVRCENLEHVIVNKLVARLLRHRYGGAYMLKSI